MDLALYARVVWRFKLLVLGGLIAAVVLAVFSVATIRFPGGKPTLAYRTSQTYQSSRTLLISPKGFPWGSLSFSGVQSGQLASLATFYAQLVTSGPMLTRLHLATAQSAAQGASVAAAPVVDVSTGNPVTLPLLRIYGRSTSPSGAVALAQRATKVFISYIAEQQQASAIPSQSRVLLKPIDAPRPAQAITSRKKTLPIMVFILVLSATIGLTFVLENLRPAVRALPGNYQDEWTTAASSPPAIGLRNRE